MLSRLKFNLECLANEMLDQVDKTIFERDDTTFLDPACGGGQFVKAVEDRLRQYGHSDENIANRVHGAVENILDVGFIKKTTGTVANVASKDPRDMKMKFDLVIGNPPFTLQTSRKDGHVTNKSGVKEFLLKSMELGDEIVMISPCHFSAPYKRSESRWIEFRETLNKFGVEEMTTFDQKEHFPNVSFENAGIVHLRKGASNTVEDFDSLFGDELQVDCDEFINTQRGRPWTEMREKQDPNGNRRLIIRMKNDGTEEFEEIQVRDTGTVVKSNWFVAVQEQSGSAGIRSAIVFDNTKRDTIAASNIHPLYAESKEDAEQLAEWVKSDKFNEMFMQVTRGERVVRGGWLKKLPKYPLS